MGAGSLQEAGEEGAGGGISKGGGSREKWEKFCNIGTIFRNRKSTQRKGTGTGSPGCGRREVQTPLFPPPIYLTSYHPSIIEVTHPLHRLTMDNTGFPFITQLGFPSVPQVYIILPGIK